MLVKLHVIRSRSRIVYCASIILALPEPSVSQGGKNVSIQATISGKINGLAVWSRLATQRASQVRKLRRIRMEMRIHVRFYAGIFSNKARFQQVRLDLEIMGSMHTRHPCPLGFNIVILYKAYRTFHVIEEEFRIHTQRIEKTIVEVKGKRTIVAVFGIIALFHEQRNRRNKQPRFQVIVLDLQFTDTESSIPHSKLVAVTKDVASFIYVLFIEAMVDSQVSIERKHTQRTKLHIKRKHVIRQRELVQAQVIVVARTPMHHVTTKVQAQPVVIQGDMRTVASVTGILQSRVIFFFLEFQEFTIKRFRITCGMTFVINAGIKHKVNGIRITAQVNTTIYTRPNRITKRFTAAVVHTSHHRKSQSHAGSRIFKIAMTRDGRSICIVKIKQCIFFI